MAVQIIGGKFVDADNVRLISLRGKKGQASIDGRTRHVYAAGVETPFYGFTVSYHTYTTATGELYGFNETEVNRACFK